MFKAMNNKGFHIVFDNGWTVSVQWGYANYCDNRDGTDGKASKTAEVAAWDASGEWHKFSDGTEVDGWYTPAKVLEFMNEIAAKPR